MKTAKIPRRGAFQPLNKCVDGESIEVKIRRIMDEKEPITDGAPIIFTDAKDGVRPEFKPRTDRWEIAIDAMDKVSKFIVTGKQVYMNAMIQSPLNSSVLKKLIDNSLTDKINDRDMFMKGIDYSYYYEEND